MFLRYCLGCEGNHLLGFASSFNQFIFALKIIYFCIVKTVSDEEDCIGYHRFLWAVRYCAGLVNGLSTTVSSGLKSTTFHCDRAFLTNRRLMSMKKSESCMAAFTRFFDHSRLFQCSMGRRQQKQLHEQLWVECPLDRVEWRHA